MLLNNKQKFLLVSILFFSVLCLFGCDNKTEKYTEGLVFQLIEGKEEYEITGYNGTDSQVIIPKSYLGLPVTQIGNSAFNTCNHVNSITLPDSIKNIDSKSFIGTNLSGEFYIPNKIYYFGHIMGLKNCDVRIKKDNLYHKEINVNGVLSIVTKDEKELIYVNNSKESNATYQIPNSITKVGDYSMSYSNFKEIILPNSITIVGNSAFMYSKAIVNIPTSIKEIHKTAYVRCVLDENLVLHEGLELIGGGAFGENNLSSIVFPSTLISLGTGIFYSQITAEGAYNKVENIEFKSFQLDESSLVAFNFSFLWMNYKDTLIKEITIKLPVNSSQALQLKESLLNQTKSSNFISYFGNDFVINYI